jgi:hypothetical protein
VGKNMKVVLLAVNDCTNLGGQCAKSLRGVGVDATMFIQRMHVFEYPDQGKIFKTSSQILPYIKKADVILFMHSQYIDTGIDLENKKVLVWHTGSRYRQHSEEINEIFNPIVNASICGRDVFGLGAKNEKWVGGLVDVEALNPVYKTGNDKIVLAHYPRGCHKGTEIIKNSIDEINKKKLLNGFIYKFSDEIVDWKSNIRRVSECDVYIEDMGDRKRHSVFGIAALEAAALGKIVVTRFLFVEEYEEKFGKCGLQISNTKEGLIQKLIYLISLSEKDLLELKKQSREWVVRCHSYEVVAKRLLKTFNEV